MVTFPIVYLSIIIIFLTFLSIILTLQAFNLYKENQIVNVLKNDYTIVQNFKSISYPITVIYWQRKIYVEALKLSQLILKNENDYTNEQLSFIYTKIANLYATFNYLDLAIDNYKLALAKTPHSIISLTRVAQLLQRKQSYSLAMQTYQKILTLDSHNKTALQEIKIIKKML